MESLLDACKSPKGCDDPGSLDLPTLTEAAVKADNSDASPESELESFRQQWKQELEAGFKKIPLNKWEAFNKHRSQSSHLRRSNKHASSVIPSPQSSSKKFSGTSATLACKTAAVNSAHHSAAAVGASPPIGSYRNSEKKMPVTIDTGDDKENSINNNNTSIAKTCTGDIDRLEGSIDQLKEQQARHLYSRGAQLERAGLLYEAIQQYRRALHLVPDIDTIGGAVSDSDDSSCDSCGEQDVSTAADTVGPITAGVSLYCQVATALAPNAPVCQPMLQQESVHLSALPREIVEQLLCWVVGRDLDMRSLHAVATVCRGLYVLTHAEPLWRKACQRVWGPDCSLTSSPSSPFCSSWRNMFLSRPQPRYNGCYISRTSYFRSGECNFIDQNYQPWHLVSYYRLLRFFPGGCALLLTTTEPPQAVVPHLATRDPRHPQVLVGEYTLFGSLVHLRFHRSSSGGSNKRPPLQQQQRSRPQLRHGLGTTDVADTALHMTLELFPSRRRGGPRNWFLCWRTYTICSRQLFGGGQARVSEVDVTQLDNFPQLAFSRVKSYGREATEPLF